MSKEKSKNNSTKDDLSSNYLKVLKLVKQGLTITDACRTIGISRVRFYQSITQEQKKELKYTKSTTLIHGTCGHFGTRDFITLENDDDDA